MDTEEEEAELELLGKREGREGGREGGEGTQTSFSTNLLLPSLPPLPAIHGGASSSSPPPPSLPSTGNDDDPFPGSRPFPSLSEPSTILSKAHIKRLLACLPERDAMRKWVKAYCMSRDGASLGTLLYKVGREGGREGGSEGGREGV